MSSHLFRLTSACFAAVSLLSGFTAGAQVTVIDDGLSLTPDPVTIIVGGSVIFRDDGTGPYQIISDTGAWAPFSTPGGILFSQAGSYPYHDDAGDFGTVVVSPNLPPSVTITNPASNAVFTATANFDFSVDAYDLDDGLSDVEFYVGTNLVDDVFSPPFTTAVTNLPAGTYLLTAIAYDNLSATATNQITIYVRNTSLSLSAPRIVGATIQFDVSGLTIGKTNLVQVSTSLGSTTNWVSLATNVANSAGFTFTNPASLNSRFFRIVQLR